MIRHTISALIVICLTLLLGSCTKNEFKIHFDFGESKVTESVKVVYYSSDPVKGWITDESIPVVDGKAEALGITRNPSVVYVYSSNNTLKCIFYAERGDEISIDASGETWMVSGSDINEEWSQWRKKHENDFLGLSYGVLNKDIEAYVKEHKDSKLSTLLLCTTYAAWQDPEGFERVWNMLGDDAKDPLLLVALGKNSDSLRMVGNPQRIGTLSLHSHGDTVVKISTAKASKTIFIFWSSLEYRKPIVRELKRMLKAKEIKGDSIAVVDINMQADTLGWSTIIRNDSVKHWVRAWAPGAEQNNALVPFRIKADPYVVVVDSTGKQIYRGKMIQKID